jgi:hypothetical protein
MNPEQFSDSASDEGACKSFSVRAVCTITSLGRTSVYAAIKRGDLVARKRGRRTLVLARDLQAFLDCLPSTRTYDAYK